MGVSLIPNYKSISSFLWLQIWLILLYYAYNRIGAVMASVLASTAVYSWFESQSDHTKDDKIYIRCFTAKDTALKRKSQDCYARNQENVSEWCNMYIRGLLFQWNSTKKRSNLVCWSTAKLTSSSSHWKLTCFRHNVTEKLLSWR